MVHSYTQTYSELEMPMTRAPYTVYEKCHSSARGMHCVCCEAFEEMDGERVRGGGA